MSSDYSLQHRVLCLNNLPPPTERYPKELAKYSREYLSKQSLCEGHAVDSVRFNAGCWCTGQVMQCSADTWDLAEEESPIAWTTSQLFFETFSAECKNECRCGPNLTPATRVVTTGANPFPYASKRRPNMPAGQQKRPLSEAEGILVTSGNPRKKPYRGDVVVESKNAVDVPIQVAKKPPLHIANWIPAPESAPDKDSAVSSNDQYSDPQSSAQDQGEDWQKFLETFGSDDG
ncbi:MAG: hypothetical protein M1825_004460 [Sarcosagium campestre]|nr:MAG: hypothetical protein M1825_004460 [Sarcosagium campestre]